MAYSVDDEILLRGYVPYPEIINPSQSFIDQISSLKDLETNKSANNIYKMKLKDIIFDSKKFLENTYHLHKVPMFNSKHILFPKMVSPFEIPIILEDSNLLQGALIYQYIPIINKFYPKSVSLTTNINELTTCCYIHELTHSQLDSVKGSINKYYNREIITRFNNLLAALTLEPTTERLLRIYDFIGIHEMLECSLELKKFHQNASSLSRDELLECGMYLISDIKAYILFSHFYFGTASAKQDIINSIQLIFDGKLSVESLNSKYEANLKSSSVKKMLKYFRR